MKFKKIVEFIVITCVAIALTTFCFTLISSPDTLWCILGFVLVFVFVWFYFEYVCRVIETLNICKKLKNKKSENKKSENK